MHNFLFLGQEPGPPILPNSEYPDWLFKIDISEAKEVEDLDPEKDGLKYWIAWEARRIQQTERFEELKYKHIHLQNSPSLKHLRYSKYNFKI